MKRRTSRISWVLVVLILFELFDLSVLNFVKASGEASLPTTYASSTATIGTSYVYDATNSLTTDIQINAASGKQILKITADMPDGRTGIDITPIGAIGQSSYRLQTELAGFGVDVISRNNDTAQGYTSWQRYTVGDPKGPYWFANLSDGNTAQCGFADGVPADSDYPSLPAYPGCNSTSFPVDLSLSGSRATSYQLAPNGSNLPSTIVDRRTLQGQVTINDVTEVAGPAGIPTGTSYDSTTYNNRIDFGSTDNFTVHYNQNFNQSSPYSQDFALTGAKQMVYYAAFTVTITGKTYAYPKTINIIYQDAPAAPNLGGIGFMPGCVEKDVSNTFNFTFTNSGATAIAVSFNVRIMIDGSVYKTISYAGLAGGATASGSFAKTFSSQQSVSIIIDTVPSESNTGDNSLVTTITPQASCAAPTPPPAGPEVINGDFHLEKTSMNFGQSNAAFPDNVSVSGGAGCSIAQFGYTFTQGGLTYNTVGPASSPAAQNFAGPPYPGGMGGGTVSVTMTIKTSCGTTKVVGPKTFDIIVPSGNNPPVFNGAWFAGGNSSSYPSISQVIVGNYVDLGVEHNPMDTPKTPYDPDGDGIVYTWDFKGSSDPWIQAIGVKFGDWNHDEHYRLIKADVLGSHTVYVSAVDTRGASVSPRAMTINVILPNPVAVITLPPKVVEGRTVSPAISGASSYSPIGSSIISYDWHGTYSSYYSTAGSYPIKLDVTDSGGLTSLAPDMKTLTVLPDYPPIAQLLNPGSGMRGNQMVFIDQSYSPDGDPISEHSDTLACDTNNNGSYADETSYTLTPDSSGNIYYNPTRIGNCKIHVHIREALGYMKSDDKDYFFTVNNDQPNASFSMLGSYQPPSMSLSTSITTDNLLSSPWKLTSLDGDLVGKYWYKTSSGTLKTAPVYGEQALSDKRGSYNGLNLTQPVTFRAATASEKSAVTSSGTAPWITYTKTGCQWWGCPDTTLVKTVDGVQQWSKTEIAGIVKGNIVFSPDMSRFAYSVNATVCTASDLSGCYATAVLPYLRIADSATGNILISNQCAVCGEGMRTAYENRIITTGLSIFDWNGTLLLTGTVTPYEGVYPNPTTGVYYSKEGYLYLATGNHGGDSNDPYSAFFSIEQYDLQSGTQVGTYNIPFTTNFWNPSSTNAGVTTMYSVGDGLLYVKLTVQNYSGGVFTMSEGVIQTALTSRAKREPYSTFGQYTNPSNTLQDGELTYQFKFASATTAGEPAGFSFRMANYLNFYRVEHNSNATSLVAYVNGSRFVIQSNNYPIANGTFYNTKIKVSGNHIKAYVNGALVIDVYESTFAAPGMYGPYTTKGSTEFKGITVLKYPPMQYLNNVVVVGNPIQYYTNYSDTEKDPTRAGSIRWTFSNQQPYMYLNAGDGYSDSPPTNSYNNQVVTSPNAAIYRVGYFKIDYQVADDPSTWPYNYADGTFSSYSKYSDPYTQYAKVVRVPIANFTPYVNGDNSLGYTDQSYDPDRCYNINNCQGGYGSNHGILDHRWKYTAPNGTMSLGFPTRPNQTGTYNISEAVMQEDGISIGMIKLLT